MTPSNKSIADAVRSTGLEGFLNPSLIASIIAHAQTLDHLHGRAPERDEQAEDK